MDYPINEKCIIRTNRAGVFFATLAEYDDQTRTATLKNCRRIWKWVGACSLSQLATEGVKDKEDSKFTVVIPQMQVMEVIEIIPCSASAVENIESVKVWKR